ncbi:hypothetical protein F2Q68_00013800 [Brassica cretica]|uniref:Uncharacterized protein n=1 Tax=Brassica cretica TaxID=69181 RepID=A0A8S9HCP3_BRACR|nr:hypothetical protein F2Q68_00013800 [Brassica cretica]
MIMMFASAFALPFALPAVSNIMEIKTIALKLLVTLETIGASLNAWQVTCTVVLSLASLGIVVGEIASGTAVGAGTGLVVSGAGMGCVDCTGG